MDLTVYLKHLAGSVTGWLVFTDEERLSNDFSIEFMTHFGVHLTVVPLHMLSSRYTTRRS